MEESLKLKRATYHLWTFTISKLISSFGAQVYSFAISFYILHLTGSATSFAMNLLCNILPRTLAAPFAGYIVDKYPKKMIIICTQIATTISVGGLLFVSVKYGLSLPAIYTTTCLLSLTSMFSGVTFSSSITGLVDEARVQRAMSLNQMSISFASIASPAVGGLLYGAVSMPVFLVTYMAASVIAVTLESTMNFRLFTKSKGKAVESAKKESMLQSMKEGLKYLKLQQVIMVLIWISLIINFLFGAFEVGYSYILIEKLKMASRSFGLTQGAFAVGMLLFSIYFSIRKEVKYPFLFSKRGILVMGLIMGAMGGPLWIEMSKTMSFVYYLVLMFSFGSTIILVNTPISVMMQKQIDDEYKGRVFSILETMATALMPLGMVLYGFLYDVLPAQWILLASAAILIGVVLVLARPSVIRKLYPDLNQKTIIKPTTEVV